MRVFVWAVAAFLIAATALPLPAALAGEPPPDLTDFKFGRILFKAGELEDARAFLERARPENQDEAIERLFLLGRIAMHFGRFRQAAERFEAILADHPGLTRVRLELASAYYAAGRDDKARFHFEAALADRTSSSVATAVEGFLDRIDERKRWSSSLSVALAPQTNPARRTDRRRVRIGPVPFELGNDARADSGVGVLISGGVSWTPAIGDDLRAVLAAATASRLYEQSAWNDITLQGDLGLARLFDLASLSGGIRIGRRWLAGDGYNRSVGPWARGGIRLSDRTSVHAAVSAEYLKHDVAPDSDGWGGSARPGLVYRFGSRTSLDAGLDLEIGAGKGHRGSRLIGARLALAHGFEGGLSLTPGVAVYRRRHDAPDPLFGNTRVDRNLRLSITILHRSLQYRGFAPHVGLAIEYNRSTLDLNDYQNRTATVGLSRTF